MKNIKSNCTTVEIKIGPHHNHHHPATMETRLQSNEIRIPKPEFHLRSNGTGDLNTSMTSNGSEREPGSSSHYFKSSFARSLSTFGSSPQSKSLDFAINYGYPQIIDDDDGPTLMNSTLLQYCPLSMPHMFSGDEDCFLRRALREEKPGMQSTESLASSSSVATTVKNVWTGVGNAQVCVYQIAPFLP